MPINSKTLNITNLFLVTIFILGILSRFLSLSKLPPSLNWDEISHGYTAYSLLTTGKDQWGLSWPLFNTRAYGDYPTMVNIYLTIPSIIIFGLTPLATRLPSAICGFVLIPLAYFIAKKLFNNKNIATISAFLTLISPWTFFPSRAVFQSTVAQAFLLFAIALFLYRQKSKLYIYLCTICAGISMYAYHNTRIFIPSFILGLLVFFYKSIKLSKTNVLALLLFLVFLVPQVINLASPGSQARSRWVFLINPASINEINNLRNSFSNQKIAKYIYNKPTYLGFNIAKNYANFFNPIPLFFTGTQNHQFSVPGFGLLFSICLPFFYLGLINTIRTWQKPNSKIMLLWLFTGLIPASVTYGDYPVIRMMSILPLPLFFVADGMVILTSYFAKYQKIINVIIILILTIQATLYYRNYTTYYFQKYSASWQYGYQQTVDYLKINYSNYDHIYFTKNYGEPHEFILFYWPWNPQRFQVDPQLSWNFHADWYWVDTFDKFIFLDNEKIKSVTAQALPRSLLVTTPSNYPANVTLIKTIYFLNHQPAFDIVKL